MALAPKSWRNVRRQTQPCCTTPGSAPRPHTDVAGFGMSAWLRHQCTVRHIWNARGLKAARYHDVRPVPSEAILATRLRATLQEFRRRRAAPIHHPTEGYTLPPNAEYAPGVRSSSPNLSGFAVGLACMRSAAAGVGAGAPSGARHCCGLPAMLGLPSLMVPSLACYVHPAGWSPDPCPDVGLEVCELFIASAT